MATLTFLGAARTVTGSRYLLESGQTRVLIDCGMFQARQNQRYNWENYGLNPADIHAVLLTHGHMDHCGWLPKLVKEGFKGHVYCTAATADLVPIILLDIAKIQEEDARTKAKRHAKEKRRDVRPAVPLYDTEDAEKAIAMLRSVPDLGVGVQVAPGVRATWNQNGHILGASWITVEAEGRTIVFSGDIGRWDRPILHDPQPPKQADYLVTESTYGDRFHLETDVAGQLEEIIADSARRGGNLLIPSFSVERAQELLYNLANLGEQRKLWHKAVYLDSPMATKVTDLFRHHPAECDEEMTELVRNGKSPFAFAGLHYTVTAKESQKLNALRGGAVIIAGNGMCTGGRIKHHLRHNLERPEATVLFVGYQAPGTLGRQLLDGAAEVRLFNRIVKVRADIKQLSNISGHADQNELLRWAGTIQQPPKGCFVTHGDEEATEVYAGKIRETFGWAASTPQFGETVVLE